MDDERPRRGEVWRIDLETVRGHEQGGQRPAVVVSANTFNAGPAGLIVICPLTTRERRIRLHVPVDPPEGGLRMRSFVLCDQVRTVSRDRLTLRLGMLQAISLAAIEERLRILLEL